MAERLEDFDWDAVGHQATNKVYPDEWFDGATWKLPRADWVRAPGPTGGARAYDDDTVTAKQFLNRLASAARSRGFVIQSRTLDADTVVVRFTPLPARPRPES